MIAVDTNLLVYAHRSDTPWHGTARKHLADLAAGRAAWAIPWPCVHEFLGVVTHSKIFARPTPLDLAIAEVEGWRRSPPLVFLAEGEGYWAAFRRVAESAKVQGPRTHDARIAALCAFHGVRELWTADRDFSRFPGLAIRNPLVA